MKTWLLAIMAVLLASVAGATTLQLQSGASIVVVPGTTLTFSGGSSGGGGGGGGLPPPNVAYYISAAGNDGNAGTQLSPWGPGCTNVNNRNFQAGDQILFRGGDTFACTLTFDASDLGVSTSPIVLSSYGTGRATINGGNNGGLYAHNTAGIRITNINFLGSGATTNTAEGVYFFNNHIAPNKAGVSIDLVDVSGFGRHGVFIFGEGAAVTVPGACFNNITVTDSTIHDNRTDGLLILCFGLQGKGLGLTNWHDTVVVRNVTAYNNTGWVSQAANPFRGGGYGSGSGIEVAGAKNVVIENNLAYNNGTVGWGGVGIWAVFSDNVLMQSNESHHNHDPSTADGDGFNFDGITNSIMQYNYSHDNDGCGVLLDDYVGEPNTFGNNIVRYNLSVNDATTRYAGIFIDDNNSGGVGAAGPTEIYGNTVVGPRAAVGIQNEGAPSNLHFRNNIFVRTTAGSLLDMPNLTYSGWLFNGDDWYASGNPISMQWDGTTYSTFAAWKTASSQEAAGVSVTPLFVVSGSGSALYKLQATSTLIDAGVNLAAVPLTTGGRDFFGSFVPSGAGFDIGAAEYTTASAGALGGPIPINGAGYSATSPHWPHIKVGAWLRQLCYAPPVGSFAFAMQRIDIADDNSINNTNPNCPTKRADMEALNSTIKFWTYDLDLTTCLYTTDHPTLLHCNSGIGGGTGAASEAASDGGMNEADFLHFDADTTLTITDSLGTHVINITGCHGGAVARSCRAVGNVGVVNGFGSRWMFDLSAAHFRTVMTANLAVTSSLYKAIFLDEHLRATNDGIVVTGGTPSGSAQPGDIREWPGANIQSLHYDQPTNTATGCPSFTGLTLYEKHRCNWMAALRATPGRVRELWPNTASAIGIAGYTQLEAAGGYSPENAAQPGGSGGNSQGIGTMDEWLARTSAALAAGATFSIEAVVGNSGTPSTGGNWAATVNYSSYVARYRMWGLVQYYLAKEPVGSPGTVYFQWDDNMNRGVEAMDPTCDDTKPWKCSWFPAIQVDVGTPVAGYFILGIGPYPVTDNVTSPFAVVSPASGTACAGNYLTTFARFYTRALVILRPVGPACNDYVNGPITITLDKYRRMLNVDGTLGTLTNTVTLNIGEAVIMGEP
jgi:hypothetical protein